MSVISEELFKRNLPELLYFDDGSPVTPEDWEARRAQLLEILSSEEYGFAPPSPEKVNVTVERHADGQYAGKACVNSLRLSFETDRGEFSFPVMEIVPTGKKNCPTFVVLNFRADVPDKYLPAEEIIDYGCASLRIYYNDIAYDGEDDSSGGIAAMYDRGKYNWGKLRMWAFAASRVMDYLQSGTADYPDLSRIVVAGHSRLGKAALIAAAFDTRFALACANDSGCSGDALTRGKKGERVGDIVKTFPFWFCEKYKSYSGRETEMPFDQHFLLAAVAPRRVALGAALEDEWADPDSQYLSACAASGVWDMLGRKGFITPDRLPLPGDCFSTGCIKYHLRRGRHFLSREDWQHYCTYILEL